MALEDYFTGLIVSLQQFRESDFLCDTVLVTDDKHELKAHSVVLAAASSVFRTAFASAADRGPGPLQVNLREYESDVVEIALQFIYTGKLLMLPSTFEHKNEWLRLVAVVERLGLDLQLLKDCEKTFQEHVPDTTPVDEQNDYSNDTVDDLLPTDGEKQLSELPRKPKKQQRNGLRKKPREKSIDRKSNPSQRRSKKNRHISVKQELDEAPVAVVDAAFNETSETEYTEGRAMADEDEQDEMLEKRASRTGVPPIFVCSKCGRSFVKKERLMIHERTHTGERPYNCDTCGRRFSLLGNLRRHMLLHSAQKPFMCELCGRTFIRRAYLEDHLAVHATAHPYACNACPKRFNSAGQLRLHFRFVHDRQSGTIRTWYPCEICNKRFSSKGNLKTHSRVHTGERPFVCACGKAYAQRVQLIQHSYIHSDERPFICQLCSRSFRFRASLVIHTRTHTGERPHVCEHCGKSYTNKAGLRSHASRMHNARCQSADIS